MEPDLQLLVQSSVYSSAVLSLDSNCTFARDFSKRINTKILGKDFDSNIMTTNYRDPALVVPAEEVSQVVPRVLSSPSSQYLVQSVLGVGGFGNVVKCLKAATRETVAVKILQKNNITPLVQKEVAILEQLRSFNSDSFNFVRYNDGFIDREYICLEFEILDMSLWDYLQTRPSRSLSVKQIRPVLHQMATVLQFLKNIGIVHTDIKPDNIMMVDHINQPMKIKLIDFGFACHVSESKLGTYTRALPYRALENILGFPITPALDMWALGCVAAELFTGNLLYPANSEYAMIRYMVQTQGQLPQQLLEDGINTKFWFVQSSSQHQWRLKTMHEYGDSSWTKTCINSLDDLTKVKPVCHLSDEDTMAEIKDQGNFVDLLKKMLHLDVDKRITPSHLLEDPFITMNDLSASYPKSLYVKSCCELMEVCQNQSLSCQDLPAWHSRQEHPIILELASAFSSGLNISMEAPSYRDRLKPGKKRLRSTSPLSDKSLESTQPDRKRKKMDMDFFTNYFQEAPTKASSSTAERKPQRKRKWDVFIGSHISLRKSSEPERKQMKMSLETVCDSQQAFFQQGQSL
ncbi:homeodomain-interacting protein kinase 3-like [Larimichthys crocea]|uniref:homeodomain-interacting protein kinase 3-like n=1 Tax=Larimichthys crocea TaxID=215358 RepID=UPI000F5E44A5|nr:homeodomain-interacting protein kinase 3-like [Larimichthys crocea]